MSDELYRDLSPEPENSESVSRGRYIIAVIGIDDYTYWSVLHNAVSDAQGVYKLFVKELNSQASDPPLFNNDATKDAITELIRDRLRQELQPDDNFVLFFAGHGHTEVSRIGNKEIKTGYLIPVNARKGRRGDYIDIKSFLEDVGRLPARHILAILDSCHSGLALDDAIKVFRGGESTERYEEDLIRNCSRVVITAARCDQRASDSGPVPGQSLFTGTLLDGFNSGEARGNHKMWVTSRWLGQYLQERVGQASRSGQTPDYGEFHLDERGEMIIRLPNFVSNSALRQPERLSEYIEIEIAEARIRETIAQARIDLGQAQMDQLRLLKLQLAQPNLSLPPAQTSIKSLIDKYYEDAQKGIRS